MAEASSSTHCRRKPWAITVFGFLTIGALISMPILAGDPDGTEMPDLVRFIGHFHPLVLHLPIGVFTLILFQEIAAMFSGKKHQPRQDSLFPIGFGAASAIVAVIAGFLLYHGHGEDYAGNELAGRHLWGGLIFSVAAVLTFILKTWTLHRHANPAWYRVPLFLSVGVMGFTSHDGASITHGSDFLTEYAPAPIRKLLGLSPKTSTSPVVPATDPVVYTDIVAPIFERRCVQCHREDKAKGRLRMDTYEMLVKGGKEGPGIEPGSAATSNIVIRMDLPLDDDDHMPPEGKPQVDEAELLVIKWWLDQGADPAKTLSKTKPSAEIHDALAKLPAAAPARPRTAAPSGPDDTLKTLVETLSESFPGALTYEPQNPALVTFSAIPLGGKLDDTDFGKLAPVIPHLVTVDLSATRITDEAVAMLEPAAQLRLLRLAETEVTDAAIDTLLKLTNLESINFHSTQVTDAGILKLAALPNLKRLFLWQTSVTPEAVKSLQEQLPNCQIITRATATQ